MKVHWLLVSVCLTASLIVCKDGLAKVQEYPRVCEKCGSFVISLKNNEFDIKPADEETKKGAKFSHYSKPLGSAWHKVTANFVDESGDSIDRVTITTNSYAVSDTSELFLKVNNATFAADGYETTSLVADFKRTTDRIVMRRQRSEQSFRFVHDPGQFISGSNIRKYISNNFDKMIENNLRFNGKSLAQINGKVLGRSKTDKTFRISLPGTPTYTITFQDPLFELIPMEVTFKRDNASKSIKSLNLTPAAFKVMLTLETAFISKAKTTVLAKKENENVNRKIDFPKTRNTGSSNGITREISGGSWKAGELLTLQFEGLDFIASEKVIDDQYLDSITFNSIGERVLSVDYHEICPVWESVIIFVEFDKVAPQDVKIKTQAMDAPCLPRGKSKSGEYRKKRMHNDNGQQEKNKLEIEIDTLFWPETHKLEICYVSNETCHDFTLNDLPYVGDTGIRKRLVLGEIGVKKQ